MCTVSAAKGVAHNAGNNTYCLRLLVDEAMKASGISLGNGKISLAKERFFTIPYSSCLLFEICHGRFKQLHIEFARHILIQSVSDSFGVSHLAEDSAVR